MKGRDLALLLVVVGIAGFALSDTLRGHHSEPRAETRRAVSVRAETRPAETFRIQTVEDLPTGLLGGRLVYSDAQNGCAVSELDLASGTVFPLPPLRSTCAIVSAPLGERVAFTLPSTRRNVMPYRVVDLDHPDTDIGSFRALNSSVRWSPDGQTIGWCDPRGRGHELVVGVGERTLAACPAAYSPDGTPAFVRGDVLTLRGRRFRAPGRILAASFARNGSLALLDTTGRIGLYRVNGSLRREIAVPLDVRAGRVVFSPTNCSVAYLATGTPAVVVLPVDRCPGLGGEATFPGNAVSWSPDGRWLAVANDRMLTLHRADGRPPAIRIRLAAVDVAWKP